MLLYTCAGKKTGASLGHPCGKASKALDDAGHTYDLEVVAGFKNVPFTTGGGKRDKLVDLTGNKDAPVLVLADGTVVAGSSNIAEWARAHPPG